MDNLTKTLDLYLVKKAPALPKPIKALLVKLAPWIEIVGLFWTVSSILSVNYSLPLLFLLAIVVLKILSIPGLLKRAKAGWNYVYYLALVEAFYWLSISHFFGLLVGTAISLYLVFQVRDYYK